MEHPASNRRGDIRSERGAAVVEFALVMPLLFFLLFGLIVFGWILATKQSVTHSSEDAARSAVGVFVSGASQTFADIERVQRAFETAVEGLGWIGDDVCCDTDDPTHKSWISGSDGYRNGAPIAVNFGFNEDCDNTGTDQRCFTVEIVYDYEAEPVLPVPASTPPFSFILPDTISSHATVRIS